MSRCIVTNGPTGCVCEREREREIEENSWENDIQSFILQSRASMCRSIFERAHAYRTSIPSWMGRRVLACAKIYAEGKCGITGQLTRTI